MNDLLSDCKTQMKPETVTQMLVLKANLSMHCKQFYDLISKEHSLLRSVHTSENLNGLLLRRSRIVGLSLCLVAMVVMRYTAPECQCWTVTVKAITQLLHCLKLNVLFWLSNWACWTYWLTVKLFLAVLVLTFSSRICQPCRRLEWTRRIQRVITFNDKQHSAVKLNQTIILTHKCFQL